MSPIASGKLVSSTTAESPWRAATAAQSAGLGPSPRRKRGALSVVDHEAARRDQVRGRDRLEAQPRDREGPLVRDRAHSSSARPSASVRVSKSGKSTSLNRCARSASTVSSAACTRTGRAPWLRHASIHIGRVATWSMWLWVSTTSSIRAISAASPTMPRLPASMARARPARARDDEARRGLGVRRRGAGSLGEEGSSRSFIAGDDHFSPPAAARARRPRARARTRCGRRRRSPPRWPRRSRRCMPMNPAAARSAKAAPCSGSRVATSTSHRIVPLSAHCMRLPTHWTW